MEKNKSKGINRRQFLGYSTAAIAGASVPSFASGATRKSESSPDKPRYSSYREMLRDAKQYRKIDTHNHINTSDWRADLIDESCERVGITKTAVSNLGRSSLDAMKRGNDIVLEGMDKYPDRILGSCYINPGFTKDALKEIDRCVNNGMVMVGEIYDDYKISDPVTFPIIERCIEHNIPFMMHAGAPLEVWRPGYRTVDGNPQTTTTAEDFIEVADRYPEAMIIHGHIAGGGDWEYTIEVLQDLPNIYAETAGSVHDARIIDMAVEKLGADRLLFSTDVNYETGVGKVMFADLTEEERKKIFFDNFNNLLKKAGNNVD